MPGQGKSMWTPVDRGSSHTEERGGIVLGRQVCHCAHAVSSVQVPQEQMVCLAYAGGDASIFSVSSAPLADEF